MTFTSWKKWFISFFYRKTEENNTIECGEVHGKQNSQNTFCLGTDADPEATVSIKHIRAYKTVEKINPHCGLIFQQEKKDFSDHVDKLEDMIEKIRKYNILDEDDYEYIKSLQIKK